MSEQDDRQVATLQRPTTDDPKAWKAYWKAQDQSWRTEPEIDSERQKYLTERRAIVPDIENGIYPFKDIKLSRADMEWLLATHENGRGPVDWSDKGQRERKGLDLRGAILIRANLSNLPLARVYCGLVWYTGLLDTPEQHDLAGAHLESTKLRKSISKELLFVTHSFKRLTWVEHTWKKLT